MKCLNNYIHPTWPAPSNVAAFTTTRCCGVSRGNYASFNLAIHVGDEKDLVLRNRAKLLHDLQLSTEPFWLTQTHSSKVICLDELADAAAVQGDADASFTTKPGKVCVVMTADCLPLLVCAKDGSIVAAIHAGWRGLAGGVIEATLKAMNYKNSNLLVWLGPAIGPKSFVVGEDVRTEFLKDDKAAEIAFVKQPKGKWLADIYLLACQRLLKCGIKDEHIYGGNLCSYADEKKFFSYRRDQGITGRMANLIWLKS